MKQLMGSSDFKRKLTAAYNAGKALGPVVQELLDDGFLQAMPQSEGGHGSLQRLTMVVQMAEHVRTVNTKKVQAYIKAHADVKWTKNEDKTHSFKFRDKPSVTLPEYPWFEHNDSSHKATVDLDVMKEIKRLLNKAAKEGATIKDDKDMLPKIRDLAIENGIQWQHTEKKSAAGKHTKRSEERRVGKESRSER